MIVEHQLIIENCSSNNLFKLVFLEHKKMNSSERIVLITGGSGYIGHFISKELIEKNYSVVLYDLRPPQEAEAGVSYIQVLRRFFYVTVWNGSFSL